MNPDYTSTYVFDNDFPALSASVNAAPVSMSTLSPRVDKDSLLQAHAVSGTCRVMCFSPKLNLTLPLMDEAAIVAVIDTWIKESVELASQYEWVQIFENRGETMVIVARQLNSQIQCTPCATRSIAGLQQSASALPNLGV